MYPSADDAQNANDEKQPTASLQRLSAQARCRTKENRGEIQLMNLPGKAAVHAEKDRIVQRQTRTPSSRARFEPMPTAFSQLRSTRVDLSLVSQALFRQSF